MNNVKQVFIGDGATITADGTSAGALTSQLSIVGGDMTAINSNSDTITTQPTIYIVNKYSDGKLKYSNPIKGTSVVGWKAEHYVPARRNVWGIGYQRGSIVDGTTVAASGSIEVNASTEYSMRIVFKNDKSFYSERPESLFINFTSAAAATQSTIATQIVNAVNNSAFGSQPSGIKELIAVKVGDGTGAYGLTGATNFGVEITGLTINQFQNTQYAEELVYFSCHVDDASGFGATTQTEIQSFRPGIGTYNQAYNAENFAMGTEGVLNRRSWPVPTFTLLSSSTAITSGNVAAAATTPTGNVTTVSGEDVVTVATATTGLRPGELIDIDGVAYEIKYVKSSTTFVITAAASASYGAGANLKVKYFYNVYNITVQDVTIQSGSGVSQVSRKTILIFSPAINTSDADPFDRTLDTADLSEEGIDIVTTLNSWMTSTPLAPATVTLA